MADNVVFQPVTATPIDGTIIATDDCVGAQVQLFKQAISANGDATLIPATGADGLLVNLGANNDVTVTGTVSATVSGVVDVGEITGPVALPTGAATSAKQDTQTTALGTLLTDIQLRAVPVPVSGTFWQATQPVSGTFWQATQPVSLAATVAVKELRASTGTATNVASSATNVTILASNANRLGATIYNDSTQVLYLKLGATASATSFAVAMVAASYYEVPFGYTGVLDGLWASANGNARVTELT